MDISRLAPLQSDLHRALTLMDADWSMQNNTFDNRTNFIYRCETLDQSLQMINETGADMQYALHRWYNYMTSVAVEYLFCEFGAVHEKNICNHDVDIYINGIPYDVKLSVYPAALAAHPIDLKKWGGRKEMICWLYSNQSQQSRRQMLNRIYVMADGGSRSETLKMKSDFDIIREKVRAYFKYLEETGTPTRVKIPDNQTGSEHILYSELLYVTADRTGE